MEKSVVNNKGQTCLLSCIAFDLLVCSTHDRHETQLGKVIDRGTTEAEHAVEQRIKTEHKTRRRNNALQKEACRCEITS